MELILQDKMKPGLVLDALLSLTGQGADRLRIAVAYTTLGGSELLMAQLRQLLGAAEWDAMPKILVTSVDYGLTEPEALRCWTRAPNTSVLLANAHLLLGRHLRPTNAFHPKLYLLDYAGRQSCLVGSANLSRRALTVNDEIVAVSRNEPSLISERAWDGLTAAATPLTDQMLQQYGTARPAGQPYQVDDPPPPVPVRPAAVPVFPDEVDAGRLSPERFQRFWVEAGAMTTGGSRNILEMPRHANAFFGFGFRNYAEAHVVIGHPVITLGSRRWADRQLAWHGAPRMNKMERLTLPTRAQGAPPYANTAVLFRRHDAGFELEVADWHGPLAAAWRNGSVLNGHVYRLGGRGPRICGLL